MARMKDEACIMTANASLPMIQSKPKATHAESSQLWKTGRLEDRVKMKVESRVMSITDGEELSLLSSSTVAMDAYAKAHVDACTTGKAVLLQMLSAVCEAKYSHAQFTAQFTPDVQATWLNETKMLHDASGLLMQLNKLMSSIEIRCDGECMAMQPIVLCEPVSELLAEQMQDVIKHVRMWRVCQAIDDAWARLEFWEVIKWLEE